MAEGQEDEAKDTPSAPGDFICFDATPLLAFNKIGELAVLEKWFPDACVPGYVMREEILEHKEKYTENKVFEGAAWPRLVEADTMVDTALMASLSLFFPKHETKNVGELHVIALTHRYTGTAILDDNGARNAAGSTTPPVMSTFMVSMIAAAAVSGWLTDAEAWDLQWRIEEKRPPGVALLRLEHKKEFKALLRFLRQVEKRLGWEAWPQALHNRWLDAASVSARKNELDILFKRFGFAEK